jgi:hypothetical protein
MFPLLSRLGSLLISMVARLVLPAVLALVAAGEARRVAARPDPPNQDTATTFRRLTILIESETFGSPV